MARLPGKCCALTVILAVVLGYASHTYAQGDLGPPWACVQYPLIDLGDGIIYYADLYETSCDDNPEPAYVFGDYDWPQTCPDCVPGGGTAFAPKQFRGLEAPITEEFVLQLPEGPARTYSKATEVPGLKFIQFKGANGNLITAKVFAFQTYKRRLLQQSVPDNGRTIVVAMQLKGEPSIQPVSLKCNPLDKPEACFAYSAEYDQGAGERIPILILTAR